MLSKAEEKIMNILWKNKSSYMKDIMNSLPEPKPAKTTVSTLLKRMIEKDMVTYEMMGNVRLYTPKIAKKNYFSKKFSDFKSSFFDNSSTQFASFFTKDTNLSIYELEAIQKIINEELKKKKQ